jgi:CubicO group peptidase (beta-lactamase class C family)
MRGKWVAALVIGGLLGFQGAVWAAAEAPAGHWEGKIDIPGSPLEFDVDFVRAADGSWSGDISIPAQNARNLPLAGIEVEGGDIRFAIADVPGDPLFKGTIDPGGSAITGLFTQGGAEFPFELKMEEGLAGRIAGRLAGFADIVERGLRDLIVPGVAVAVVAEEKLVLARGYGYADYENKRPMTADTLLAIGSSTKAFTTFTMGTLVDAGRMEWNEPVRTSIPWFKLADAFASQRITPVDLITHRSGLPRHDLLWYNNLDASREDLVRRLAYLKPTADLRERFQYNNLMFLTAGYLTEVITGETWEDSVRRRVLAPLGMTRTNFSVEESQRDPDHALPYRVVDKTIERIPFRNITTVGPAGSINSSAGEMSRWVTVHLNRGSFQGREILRPQTLEKMHSVHMAMGGTVVNPEISPSDYGLGWMIDTYRGRRRVRHGGNIDGFSALVCLFPGDGFGFVILANKNGAALPELLARHAADQILDFEGKDWIQEAVEARERGEDAEKAAKEKKATRRVEGTRPSHRPEDYAGIYLHPGYGPLTIELGESGLCLRYNGIRAPLSHWHYDTYNAGEDGDPTFEDAKINFLADADGRIARLEAPMEPALDPIVFDKQPDPRLFDPEYLKTLTGRYQLVNQTITVTLKGDVLTATLPGQPEYELVPGLEGEFHLKQVMAFAIRFLMGEEGEVTGLEIIQPDGVYAAEKIKTREQLPVRP